MKQVLFVCTGNTCRSPMAEALFRGLAERQSQTEYVVRSAGLFALDATVTSAQALQAVEHHGWKTEAKPAQQLTVDVVEWADAIYVMTGAHQREIVRRFPHVMDRVWTIGAVSGTGEDVADPYGGDVARYILVAAQLQEAMHHVLAHVRSVGHERASSAATDSIQPTKATNENGSFKEGDGR